MNAARPAFGEVQSRAMQLLSAVNERRTEFSAQPEYFDVRTAEFLLLARRVLALPNLRLGRILEVGCGGAYSLRLWSDLVKEAVGIDLPASLEPGHRFLDAFKPRGKIQLVPGTGESLDGVAGPFDLILTQYVLEHVADIPRTLSAIRSRLAPGGCIVHVLNNVADRTSWYVEYRLQTTLRRRLWDSLKKEGFWRTLRAPFRYTAPHEPRFGPYPHELQEYRLEKWALRFLREGFEVIDYFQTRDTSWAFVTRPLDVPTREE